MCRWKALLGLTICIVALSLSAAAAQAAPEWWVSGSVIAKSEAIAGKPVVTQTITFSSKALTVACKTVEVINGAIAPGNKDNLENLVFGSCSDPANAHCAVSAIKTKRLNFPLQGEKGNIKLNFMPATGSTIAVFSLSENGGACSQEGSHEIASGPSSGMVCNYPSVETEQLEHELAFGEGSGSELTLDKEPASMIGTYKFALASGNKWSAK